MAAVRQFLVILPVSTDVHTCRPYESHSKSQTASVQTLRFSRTVSGIMTGRLSKLTTKVLLDNCVTKHDNFALFPTPHTRIRPSVGHCYYHAVALQLEKQHVEANIMYVKHTHAASTCLRSALLICCSSIYTMYDTHTLRNV